MKIALKEAEETEYWLLLCDKSPKYPDTLVLLKNLKEIQKLLNSIVASSKRKN
jgi:four helix bundle protein